MAKARQYWLFKSEPSAFSIEDLEAAPDQTTFWDGVRNYQARNMLRDDIRPGDRVLFYHSNANPPAVAGLATVVREGYPDHTAWDSASNHFDPKSSAENPRWYMVDIKFEQAWDHPVPLDVLRTVSGLTGMELLRKGSRLSIQPVKKAEFDLVVKTAQRYAQQQTSAE